MYLIKKQSVMFSIFFICSLTVVPFGLAQATPAAPGGFGFQGGIPGLGPGDPMGPRGFEEMEGAGSWSCCSDLMCRRSWELPMSSTIDWRTSLLTLEKLLSRHAPIWRCITSNWAV